jgi:hypothetical protein
MTMKMRSTIAIRALLPGLLAALLCMAVPPPALAWVDDWGNSWNDGWREYMWYNYQLQKDAQSSAEESAREAGRQVRRDELEKQRKATSQEKEAYFDAILDASKAALNAPRGVYYRKPGYTTGDGPGPATPTVTVNGVTYIYDRGVFWLQAGGRYIVVTAPFGAVVDSLPDGYSKIPAGDKTYYYFFGTFFQPKGDKYEVIKPPAGLVVGYIPDGYLTETAKDGTSTYRFGEISFKPLFIQGIVAYQVAG